MAALLVAVTTGRTIDRKGWSSDLRWKLRSLFVVVASQTLLTVTAPLVETAALFTIWVLVWSVSIGVGMPVAFSLMIDLIPVRRRGVAAGVVAGLAFAVAAVFPLEWRLEEFAPLVGLSLLEGWTGAIQRVGMGLSLIWIAAVTFKLNGLELRSTAGT